MEGKIEHINGEKGYGFIKVDGYEKNVFFHVKELVGTSSMDMLQKGDEVTVDEVVDTPKGQSAKGVRVI